MKYENQMIESTEEENLEFSNPYYFLEKKDFSKAQPRNRKQRSLGLLCINFFNMYDEDVEFINLIHAAERLGVERRRMYDIFNIFESIGVLVKKGRSEYYYQGLGGIEYALKELKEDSSALNIFNQEDLSVGVSCDDGDDRMVLDQENLNLNPRSQALAAGSGFAKCSKNGARTGKSLRQLSEEFVKLLLCSDGKLVTLGEATRILLTDANNPSGTQCNDTKVRRLYDIANVLHSIGLIEKTRYMNKGKPAFKWLGLPKETLSASKKRIFGADMTNMSIQRNKTVFMNLMPKLDKQERYEYDLAHHTHSPFGFGSTKLPKAEASVIKNETSSQAVMDLPFSHLPSYGNQALQGLFAHYTQAWNTWYVDMKKKPPELKASEFVSLPSPLRSP